jgi:hypothetical protein
MRQEHLVHYPQLMFGPADLPVCDALALFQVSPKGLDIFLNLSFKATPSSRAARGAVAWVNAAAFQAP